MYGCRKSFENQGYSCFRVGVDVVTCEFIWGWRCVSLDFQPTLLKEMFPMISVYQGFPHYLFYIFNSFPFPWILVLVKLWDFISRLLLLLYKRPNHLKYQVMILFPSSTGPTHRFSSTNPFLILSYLVTVNVLLSIHISTACTAYCPFLIFQYLNPYNKVGLCSIL